jgi:alpha-ribazole phosphatase
MNTKLKALMPVGEGILYLLRHGEISTPGILAGKTNVPLSDVGVKQLSQTAGSLQDINRCISSPLIRCHTWAKEYCQQHNLPLEVDNQLQEMDFGDWDGQRYQSLWDKTEQAGTSSIGDFWQDPWQCQPPNGETMEHFVSRVDHWWQHYCADKPLQNTLVVTHAGVIKYLLAKVLNLPIPGTVHMTSIDVPYASLIKISLYRDELGKVWSKIVL